MGQSNKRMSHQCNASTLGGGTEKGNLDLPAFKVGSIVLDGSPSPGPNRLFELMRSGEMHLKSSIHLYEAKEANLEQWDPSRAKLPAAFSAGDLGRNPSKTHRTHLRPMDSACSSRLLINQRG